jgi:hypothetical protein
MTVPHRFLLVLGLASLAGCSSENAASSPAPGGDASPDGHADVETGADTGAPDASPEADAQEAATPVTAIQFQERSRVVVVEAGSDHLAFPDVTRLSDGRLFLVYRRGATHVDATGRIMKVFGSADGASWSPEEVLYDEPDIDDRDPSVTTIEDGTVVLNYFQYRKLSAGVTLHENFVGGSSDDGATFSVFEKVGSGPMAVSNPTLQDGLWVDDQGEPIWVNASSSAVVWHAGGLMLPSYGGMALNLGNLATHPRSRLSLFRTSDLGSGWTETRIEPDAAADTWLMEPAVTVLPNGRLLMQVRTAAGTSPGSPGNLWQTVSDDGGQSWSPYEDLGFVGHAPELLQLRNGVLVSAFREINDAYTKEWVSMMYSLDEGKTWSERIQVRDCGASECGYPGLIELEGDALLMVYYAPGGESIDAVVFDFVAE